MKQPDNPPIEKVKSHKEKERKLNYKWWTTDKDEAYHHVMSIASNIDNQQSMRRLAMLKYQAYYANFDTLGFASTIFSRTAQGSVSTTRIALNVIKAVIDTITAKISKNKPRPQLLSIKGDFAKQSRAKKLNQYMDGIFDQTRLYQIAPLVFRDSAVFGTGAVHIFSEEGEIKVERVMTDEILIGYADGLYGDPASLYRKKWVSKDLLKELFPDSIEDIERAKSSAVGETSDRASSDLVVVIEAWHKPSTPKAKNGKHIIAIGNCTLLMEQYTKSYFPIVCFNYSPNLGGFYGTGVAKNLEGIQAEINYLMRNIQKTHHLATTPRTWVEAGSNVAISKISNEIGGIYKYSGQKPIFDSGVDLPDSVYNHLIFLNQKAYEMEGVSQLSANSQKPAGLNSGAALRTYQDVETERFANIGQAWEQWFLDIAAIFIDMSRDLYKDNKDPSVKVNNKKFIETIKWKDVDLKNDQFSMCMFPQSMLPKTPEGKLAMLQDLQNLGIVTPEQSASLMDFPDVDEWFDLQNAALDNAKMLVTSILEDNVYIAPEQVSDNSIISKIATMSLERAKCNNVPEAQIRLLRQLIKDAQENIATNSAPSAPSSPPQPQGQPQPQQNVVGPQQTA